MATESWIYSSSEMRTRRRSSLRQFNVVFAPGGMGTRNAAISVSDNATGSPQMVALTGMGQDFSMAPSGPASLTVAPGQTATCMISVAPVAGFSQRVTLTCSGAPAKSTCSVVPSPISVGGAFAATATVTVSTTLLRSCFVPWF
jgi:hypothetical protein